MLWGRWGELKMWPPASYEVSWSLVRQTPGSLSPQELLTVQSGLYAKSLDWRRPQGRWTPRSIRWNHPDGSHFWSKQNKARGVLGQWEINENVNSVNFCLKKQKQKSVVSVPNEMSDQKLDTSLKYLQISPSKLSCSEGGVQPCMRTLGGTMVLPAAPIDIPIEVLQCPLPIDTVSSFLVPSSESTLSSRDGM